MAIACTKNGAAGISNAVSGVHLQRASGAQELSWTVLQLLKDTGLRNRLSHAARAFVTEHYSWAQSARAHEKVYVEVLDRAVY